MQAPGALRISKVCFELQVDTVWRHGRTLEVCLKYLYLGNLFGVYRARVAIKHDKVCELAYFEAANFIFQKALIRRIDRYCL